MTEFKKIVENTKVLSSAAEKMPKTKLGWLFFSTLALQPVLLLIVFSLEDSVHQLILGLSIIILFGICFISIAFSNSKQSPIPLPITIEPNTILPASPLTGQEKYGAYISTPMDGFGDEKILKSHRKDILDLTNYLEEEINSGLVFTAYRDVDKSSKFETEEKAFVENFDRINRCRVFILILPEKVYSSVFIEIGIALALGKQCVLFLPDNPKDVPFLLRGLSRVKNLGNGIGEKIPHILVYHEIEMDKIKRKLLQISETLFAKD